jgi:hypothetical protein
MAGLSLGPVYFSHHMTMCRVSGSVDFPDLGSVVGFGLGI